jgi:hypothetical protein
MDELISDERLVEHIRGSALFGADEIVSALRELQQRRAADKYPRGHLPNCRIPAGHGHWTMSECTCGYDQLPDWLRGGQ